MSAVADREPKTRNVADLLRRLGGIDPERVLLDPPPGTATEADAVRCECEMIDGTLVRKVMGWRESLLASYLIELIGTFARRNSLGLVTGESGFYKLLDGSIRAPDVSFVAFSSLPDGRIPAVAFPSFAPDLIVEVLSPGNTKAEMRRKRSEFFALGVKLIWELDPKSETAAVYDRDDAGTVLQVDGVLDGGSVLPGFTLPLADVFAELDRTGPGAPENPAAP